MSKLVPFEIYDICREVSRYLPFIEVLVLVKHRIFLCEIDIREVVISRLIEMGLTRPEAKEFIEQVEKTGSVLSGSFMLSLMVTPIGQPMAWRPDDIDIYCYGAEQDYRCPHCGGGFARPTVFAEFMCLHKFSSIDGSIYPVLSIIENRSWSRGGIEINEIVLDKKIVSPKDFVFDTFDFDFCKVTYDGKRLSMADPEAIVRKRCVYRGDKEAMKYFSKELEEKYYGVVYYNLDLEYVFRMNRLHGTYITRKEKYEARGFNIECRFDFGDRYMKEMYTDVKIDKFKDEINAMFGDDIFEIGSNTCIMTGLYIKKSAMSNFIDTKHNVYNQQEYLQTYSSPTGLEIDKTIKEHFPSSDYYIDSHPSAMRLTIFLVN